MKYIIVHRDGRYFCSSRMLVENKVLAKSFNTSSLAKRALEMSKFRPEDFTIVKTEN